MARKLIDPVCHMEVDRASAVGPVKHKGKSYYFCTEEDKAKFKKDPSKYM